MIGSKFFVVSFCIVLFGAVASFDLTDLTSIFLPSSSTAKPVTDEERIVGGYEADIEDHPYQVNFIVNGANGSFFCGGFIVSNRYILTAAHCAQNVDPSTVLLRAGSSFRSNGTVIPIAKVTPHPEYNNPPFDKDVGVMRTVKRIPFSDVIKPIGLPPRDRRLVGGSRILVSGWGKERFTAVTIPERLMAVDIPVINDSVCRVAYPDSFTRNQFCAGNFVFGGEGTCQGDSGGAAIQDDFAVGIVSYGRGCAYPLSPSVFADVAAPSIRDFISNQTGL